MKGPHYFTRTVAGVAAREYCLLNTACTAVIKTQYSRPDGTEVLPPPGVAWRVQAPASSLKPEQRGMNGHLHQSRQAASAMQTKTCRACGKTRPLALFMPWRAGSKPSERCEPCRESGRYAGRKEA